MPDKSPNEQYEFAVSFMKIGDYETAEFALKEFIQKNKDHDLAGSAQYWYGETLNQAIIFRCSFSLLDGYQNYPKARKLPIIFKARYYNGPTWRKRSRMQNDIRTKKNTQKQVCVTKSSV